MDNEGKLRIYFFNMERRKEDNKVWYQFRSGLFIDMETLRKNRYAEWIGD